MSTTKTSKTKLIKALAFVVASAYLTGAGPAFAANMKVTVRKVVGDVQTAQGAKWVKATVGMQLVSGAKIKTGSGGEALLTWDNGNVVKLRPLSNLVLTQVAKTGSTTNVALDIQKGGVFAKVKKLQNAKSSFNVGTPTAVAGVRGTAGEMNVSGVRLTEGSMVGAPRVEGADLSDPDAMNKNFEDNGVTFEQGQELPFTSDGLGPVGDIPPGDLDALKTEQKETEATAAEFKDDTTPAPGGGPGGDKGPGGSKGPGGEKGPAGDKGPAAGDKGPAAGDKGPSESDAGPSDAPPTGDNEPVEIGGGAVEFDGSVVDTVDSVVNDVIQGTQDAKELFDEFTGALEIIIE